MKLLVLLALAVPASAQVDPAKRRLIQFGSDVPISGNGPLGGYAFYYHNQPDVLGVGTALRMALAPVYMDSELATTLAPTLDLGLGVHGGGYARGHSEIRRGHFFKDESFHGHAAGASLSLYMRINPDARVPLSSVLRAGVEQNWFDRRGATRADFELPPDHRAVTTRIGLRLGGQEPLLEPSRAGELSAWYGSHFRSHKADFGLGGDRRMEAESHFYWMRGLLAYTFPKTGRYIGASVVAGTSFDADRLNAYKVGGALPLAAEFPLSIPGYYHNELPVRKFFLMSGRYGLPLDEARRFGANFYGTGGWLHPVPGMDQPGAFNSGLGTSLDFESPWRVWRFEVGYGYGFQAMRNGNRGSHSVGFLVQCDLEAQAFRDRKLRRRRVAPPQRQGLEWLLGR